MDDAFQKLSTNTEDLLIPSKIRRISKPNAIEFLRDYVATNRPVIITGVIDHWPLLKQGSKDCLNYLSDIAGDTVVTINVTPTGHGDCLVQLEDSNATKNNTTNNNDKDKNHEEEYIFVKPEERKMTFTEFTKVLITDDNNNNNNNNNNNSNNFDGVPYLSEQNDNLRGEFGNDLLENIIGNENGIDFATEAFGNTPDAINLWIGDERAVSSVHKDHYENMYAVVSGEKHFTLLPPSDIAYMYETSYKTGRYRYDIKQQEDDDEENNGLHNFQSQNEGDIKAYDMRINNYKIDLDLDDDNENMNMNMNELQWIPVDPAYPNLAKYPDFKYAHPINCTIKPGEVLYLPAMWYHKVSQSGTTIAINFWHDMQFDARYVFWHFIRDVRRNDNLLIKGNHHHSNKEDDLDDDETD